MSTRCQVKVFGSPFGEEEKVTLYHHTDGYPEFMIPKIKEAFEISGKGWQAGRIGKVASFLCASHPGVFEPEDHHELHGDIEYYYTIEVLGETHLGAKPTWTITCYEVGRKNKLKEVSVTLLHS